MTGKDTLPRRTVLKSLGIAGAVTSIPVAALISAQRSSESPDDDGNSSQESTPSSQEDNTEPTQMTITWEPGDPGSEYTEHGCEENEEACWHWVLTPGGHRLIEVGTLSVTFDDNTTITDDGWRAGSGAHHFDICRETGGTITGAQVDIVAEPRGPGRAEPFLTISGVECRPIDVEPAYWQLDFAEGDEPNIPPRYYPDDLMAGLGNTLHGVLSNPDLRRQDTDGQLGDVDILDEKFHFDDEDEPTEVTVEFTVDEDAPERDLHLALFELPGPFDPDEIEDQEYVRHASGTFSGGDSDSLTISLDLS